MQQAEPAQGPQRRVVAGEGRLRHLCDLRRIQRRSHQVDGDQPAPAAQPDHPRRLDQTLSIGLGPTLARIPSRQMRIVYVYGDQRPRPLHRQVQRPFGEDIPRPERLFLGVPTGLDRRHAPDRLHAGGEMLQPLQHIRSRRDQPRPPLPGPQPLQRRPLGLAPFRRHLDLDNLAGLQAPALAERQEPGRAFAAQIYEGGAEGGIGLDHPPDAARAQPMLRRIVFPLDDQAFEPAVPRHDAPDLARRVVQKGLDLVHLRQPAPASRLTVSGRGRPITAG